MMEDIKSGKDGISYVLVFKLSCFGRNAADVLSSLQVMQDFGVNLVCVEDGIDSSKDAGKLMTSVLSAVAEIEREDICVQMMEGRIQKAREGRWNGGFAPYGYQLVEQGNYLLADGQHEAIVSGEVWQAAQVKLLAQAKKYEHINRGKNCWTMLRRFPFFEEMYSTPNKYHKMFIGKWYLVLCQIQDDTVYVDYILDCRKDYGWLIK